MNKEIHLTEKDIKAIESVLKKDLRAEVIPTRYGVKIIRIKRETVVEKE